VSFGGAPRLGLAGVNRATDRRRDLIVHSSSKSSNSWPSGRGSSPRNGHADAIEAQAATPSTSTGATLGHALELQRLEHRVHRIELAILALRRIADNRSPAEPARSALVRAINSFDLELIEIRQRLTELVGSSNR
jgi:hypothetical protein